MFNTHSSSILPRDQEIALESRLSCGSSSTLHISPWDLFEHESAVCNNHITKAPLMRRAWVCQERMSSPRIIHYTSAQLFWECEHCTLSEDNAVVSSGGLTADATPRLMLLSLYQSKPSEEEWNTEPTGPMRTSYFHPLNQWYYAFIGQRYSRCSLTFQQDKLIAVSGLAKLIHDKTSIPVSYTHL